MEPLGVVDFVDEAGNVRRDVLEGLVGHEVDGLDLERLHEALGLGVVVRIAAAAHRADETVLVQQLSVGFRRVL